MTLIFLSAGIFFAGLAVMVLGLRDAPEGFEDQNGFHYLWRNDAPEKANVRCIWTSAHTEVCVFADAGGMHSPA